jgi:1,4-dihydroxy-2-naphthoate polyprenyltransferase
MTFTSAAIAGLLAFRDGRFDLLLWTLMTLGLMLAHATNNLLNDATDYVKGVDRDNYFRAQYGPQPLEHGLMTMRQLLLYAAITGGVALAAGAYLVYLRGALALGLLLLGAFFVLFYTWPLKYIGLGEIAVIIVWGPLMIGGGYYVVTGAWDWNVVIAGLPHALGATAVIFGKHIDKLAADSAKGIRTLPVLLGDRAARLTAIAIVVLQYVAVIYLIVTGFFSPALLVVLAAIPALLLATGVLRRPRPATMPAEYRADVWPLWFAAFAFVHTRRFGLLFLLGLILDIVWRRLTM